MRLVYVAEHEESHRKERTELGVSHDSVQIELFQSLLVDWRGADGYMGRGRINGNDESRNSICIWRTFRQRKMGSGLRGDLCGKPSSARSPSPLPARGSRGQAVRTGRVSARGG